VTGVPTVIIVAVLGSPMGDRAGEERTSRYPVGNDDQYEVPAAVETPVTSTVPIAPRWFRHAVVGCLALVVLVASVSEPGDGVPRTLFGIGFTVYLHLLAYAGLAAAFGYASLSADRRALVVAAGLATLYGAAIELLQGEIPYRTMAAADVLINAVGAAIGAALWWLVAPWFGATRSG
jgi:VanZ family protein